LWLNALTDRVGFGVRVITQDGYFVLDGARIQPWKGRSASWVGVLNSENYAAAVAYGLNSVLLCYCLFPVFTTPCSLPFNRQHLGCDDCLEDKREDYQNCSVLCCVRHLYTMIHTHTYQQLLRLSVGLNLSLSLVFRSSLGIG